MGYDRLTKALTSEGWKLLKNITSKTQVASFCRKTWVPKFVTNIQISSKDWNDDIMVVDDEITSLGVTPRQQLMLVADRSSYLRDKRAEELFQTSKYKPGNARNGLIGACKAVKGCKELNTTEKASWLRYSMECNTIWKKVGDGEFRSSESRVTKLVKTLKENEINYHLNGTKISLYHPQPSFSFKDLTQEKAKAIIEWILDNFAPLQGAIKGLVIKFECLRYLDILKTLCFYAGHLLSVRYSTIANKRIVCVSIKKNVYRRPASTGSLTYYEDPIYFVQGNVDYLVLSRKHHAFVGTICNLSC